MRSVSHKPRKTVIALVRDKLNEWRKLNRWSQSTAVEAVVLAHQTIGADIATEIIFDSTRPGRDEVTRQRVNAERVYRWLDEDNGNNLLPVNFLPSILAALPASDRVELANDMLAPCGLVVHSLSDPEDGFDPISHLQHFLVEFPQAKQALLAMASYSSDRTARRALQEVDDVIRTAQEARKGIMGRLDTTPSDKEESSR